MAQFAVHRNRSRPDRAPLLIDLQAPVLRGLRTRLVAPLLTADRFGPRARILNPEFEVASVRYVMSTAEMAGVPMEMLGEEIASLAAFRSEILAAIDLLVTGV